MIKVLISIVVILFTIALLYWYLTPQPTRHCIKAHTAVKYIGTPGATPYMQPKEVVICDEYQN